MILWNVFQAHSGHNLSNTVHKVSLNFTDSVIYRTVFSLKLRPFWFFVWFSIFRKKIGEISPKPDSIEDGWIHFSISGEIGTEFKILKKNFAAKVRSRENDSGVGVIKHFLCCWTIIFDELGWLAIRFGSAEFSSIWWMSTHWNWYFTDLENLT